MDAQSKGIQKTLNLCLTSIPESACSKLTVVKLLTSQIKTIVNGNAFSHTMFFCVVGFVLFKRLYRDIGDICIFLAFLGTIISICYNFRALKKDPIFIAFFLSLLIPFISWLNSKIQIPEFARDLPNPFFFYDFFFFWFIAYWTKGQNSRIAVILASYCLSVVGIYITHSNDFVGELSRGLQGARIDFNIVNAQHTSLFAGFGLISSAFLFIVKVELSKKLEAAKKSIALALSVFFIVIIVVTQSRQVWLALAVCLFFAPLANKLIFGSHIKFRTIASAYFILALITFGAVNVDTVQKRLSAESDTLTKIASFDLESVPASGSAGIRLHLWSEALEWISERPIFGSGEEARQLVIRESSALPEVVRNTFTHLHSSHLETLLSFGAVGAILVYFLILWPVIYTTILPKTPPRKTWSAFSFIVVIFWLTVNCFESYFYSSNGIFVFSVFYGIIYSFRFVIVSRVDDHDLNSPRKKYFCHT